MRKSDDMPASMPEMQSAHGKTQGGEWKNIGREFWGCSLE